MQRILIVTRNLPPLTGGMERLNWHIALELARYAEIRVVGPLGSKALAPPNVFIDEVGSTKLGAFLWRSLIAAITICRSWRPTVVLAGSGLTAPMALLAAKLCGARSAVYAHGLDLTVGHLVYRLVWLRFIASADVVLVNSAATQHLALAAGVDKDRIWVVHPGVELPTAHHGRANRSRFQIGNGKLLLSVGRLTRRKGILEFVTGALPIIVKRFPEVRFVIVGDVPAHALAASAQSISSIQEAAVRSGVGENVVFAGSISDGELSELYEAADLHVFPVRELANDPEGFGMVAIEAAAHGLATVAYRTGGVPDAVAEGRSGTLVEPGDDVSFASAVITLLERPLQAELARSFAQEFSWDRIGRKLVAALRLNAPEAF